MPEDKRKDINQDIRASTKTTVNLEGKIPFVVEVKS